MSLDALVFWFFIAAWVVVVDLIAVRTLHAVREGKRLAARIAVLADLPLRGQIAQAQTDIVRIEGALAALPNLARRAATGWVKISALARRRR